MTYPVVIRDPLADYFRLNFLDKFALRQAGVIRPFYQSLPSEGGAKVQLPYWGRDNDAPEMDKGQTLTFHEAAAAGELAYVQRWARPRKNRRSMQQALGSAGNGLDEFAAQTVDYWERALHTTLYSILKACVNPTGGVLYSSHCKDISKASGVPQPATRTALIQAKETALGDHQNDVTVMICHSSIAADLDTEDADQRILRGATYEGMLRLEDNNIPTFSSGEFTVYPTFMIGPGALGVALQQDLMSEQQYDIVTNTDKSLQTYAWATHMFGLSFTGTPSDMETGPTNVELANVANWTKRTGALAADFKFACLLSNRRKRS